MIKTTNLIDNSENSLTNNSNNNNSNTNGEALLVGVDGPSLSSQAQQQNKATRYSSGKFNSKQKHFNYQNQYFPIAFNGNTSSQPQSKFFMPGVSNAQMISNPSNLNSPFFAPNYFYSTNTYSSKQSYQNHRNYLKTKKEQNMHKLWPHSVQTKGNSNELPNDKSTNDSVETVDNKDSQVNNKNCSNETLNKLQDSDSNLILVNNENDQLKKSSINQGENQEKDADANTNSSKVETDCNQDENNLNNTHPNKTPMCLINEIVKFNKIKHEYVLLDEIGPAHKKTFFVMLKLGIGTPEEESYKSSGNSIKKAQHSAADLALKQTKYKRPGPRPKKKLELNPNINNNNAENGKRKSFGPNKLADATNRATNLNKPKKSPAPTVLLNSLCMKTGLRTNYEHFSTPVTIASTLNETFSNLALSSSNPFKSFQGFQSTQLSLYPNSSRLGFNTNNQPFQFRKNFNRINRYNGFSQSNFGFNRNDQVFTVKLKIADKDFQAEGPSLQIAKHNAASKALEFFSNQENINKAKQYVLSNKLTTDTNLIQSNDTKLDSSQTSQDKQNSPKITILARSKSNESDEKESKISSDTTNSEKKVNPENQTDENQAKSEISILHEYAYRLKKTVSFELVHESGPSHIKKFVTKCSVGSKTDSESPSTNTEPNNTLQNDQIFFEVLGEGNSKKSSKRNSAIEMLKILKEKFSPETFVKPEELKKEIDLTNKELVGKKKTRKSKAKNIVKSKKTSPEYGKGSINPISRLIQIQQAKKEPEPTFELISSTNRFRKSDFTRSRNEFVMNVSLKTANAGETLKCEGKGSTKKLAKQNAAEAMLVKLGFPAKLPSQSNLKPVLKNSNQNNQSLNSPTSSEPRDESPTTDSDKVLVSQGSIEKNEKRVKFVDDNAIKFDDEGQKQTVKKISRSNTNNNINNSNKKTNPQQSSNINQQKIKIFKDQLTANIQQEQQNQGSDFRTFLDKDNMEICSKIALELLESIKTDDPNVAKENVEFYSKTAEEIQKSRETNGPVLSAKDLDEIDSHEKKLQFKILNHGKEINYKGALDYLANCMNFKCNYQSILGRDGSVNSYLTLSILSDTDKRFNGQGSTHIESSNAAALSALEYLSKLNLEKINQ